MLGLCTNVSGPAGAVRGPGSLVEPLLREQLHRPSSQPTFRVGYQNAAGTVRQIAADLPHQSSTLRATEKILDRNVTDALPFLGTALDIHSNLVLAHPERSIVK
uniref:Mammalian cell entry protein n=1 Tax=Echinococcus granulosus TaxID=6210 RepID=A0A068W7C5_ECHGR|nr:hypothetical protein EgrG_002013600 [Echinococcus granulosus]